jgi:endonuclease III
VLRLVSTAARQQTGLVAERWDLVENQLPEGVDAGGREHALFLFMVVPNDRGVKSSALWKRAKLAHKTSPELFDLAAVVARYSNDRSKLASYLAASIGPRYANHASSAWVENAARLGQEYDGDPRALFGSSRDSREIARVIRGYKGFGPKTGGMMLRAAIGLGWASADHLEEVEMPVDVHDVRISLQTGILCDALIARTIDSRSYSTLAPVIRQFLTRICAEEKISWPEIDRSLWLIGSRGCSNRRCYLCPLNGVCDQAEAQLL